VNPRSILVIKPSSLGDVVHTLPAVARVREAHPEASITWVINPEWAPLLRGNPDIDHVHIFPRRDFQGWKMTSGLLPWLVETRRIRPDLALDFQGLLRSALIARVSGARRILGMNDGREGSRLFYHESAQVDRKSHAVERYLRLAAAAGGRDAGGDLRFPLPTGDPLPNFDADEPFVALHPFARGSGKSLTRAVVSAFCAALAPRRVVIIGRAAAKVTESHNAIDLTNQTTLLQLVWLLRQAAWTISVDSGPMHMAAAVSDRLVSIHTWTDPHRVGPYSSKAWVWKNGVVSRVADSAVQQGRPFEVRDVDSVVSLLA
jgi:ADP-heptose:LPS heptosyltransferase